MIKCIEVKETHPLFHRLSEYKFRDLSYINIICGINGCGKSTLFTIFDEYVHGKNKDHVKVSYDKSSIEKRCFCISMRNQEFDKRMKVLDFDLEFGNAGMNELAYTMINGMGSQGEQLHNVVTDIKDIIKGGNILFLDEPELSLDISEIMRLKGYIDRAKRYNSQVFVITHNPFLMFGYDSGVSFYEMTYEYIDYMEQCIITELT